MALQNPKKSCFRSEQNGHCLQHVTGVPGIFAHVFVDKVPALLARKSRVPRLPRPPELFGPSEVVATVIFSIHSPALGASTSGFFERHRIRPPFWVAVSARF